LLAAVEREIGACGKLRQSKYGRSKASRRLERA